MTVEEQKQQLLDAAEKLKEYVELIEPLFKAGHKGFAPDTDWWCIIAGWRHCGISDVKFLHDMADSLDSVREAREPKLEKMMMGQRKRAVAASEVESPCGDGCMLTWCHQYGAQDTLRHIRELLNDHRTDDLLQRIAESSSDNKLLVLIEIACRKGLEVT